MTAQTVTLPRERVPRIIENAVALSGDPIVLRQFLEHELMPQRRGRPASTRVRELATEAMALYRNGTLRKNLHLDVTDDPQERRALKHYINRNWRALLAELRNSGISRIDTL